MVFAMFGDFMGVGACLGGNASGGLHSSAGHERAYSARALSHLLSGHVERDKLAGALGTTVPLGRRQPHPLERLNAAFDCRRGPTRAASQVLLNAQPVLRGSVARIRGFGEPHQGLGFVPQDSMTLSEQVRKIQLRQTMALFGRLGVALNRLSIILEDALPACKAEPSEELRLTCGRGRQVWGGFRAWGG